MTTEGEKNEKMYQWLISNILMNIGTTGFDVNLQN